MRSGSTRTGSDGVILPTATKASETAPTPSDIHSHQPDTRTVQARSGLKRYGWAADVPDRSVCAVMACEVSIVMAARSVRCMGVV